MIRRIISRKRFDDLVRRGVIEKIDNDGWRFKLDTEVSQNYTPDTVGKIEEADYLLTAIYCTKWMFEEYIKEEPYAVEVDEYNNPFEVKHGYYVSEWMFEDRQNDIENLLKRYGR